MLTSKFFEQICFGAIFIGTIELLDERTVRSYIWFVYILNDLPKECSQVVVLNQKRVNLQANMKSYNVDKLTTMYFQRTIRNIM